MKPTIAVLYLARKGTVEEDFQSFISSYEKYPAGKKHDLVIIYKGFPSESSLARSKKLFAKYSPINLEFPDQGFDLGAYAQASQAINHDYICCLNTFSEIVSSDWLKKLYDQVILDDVGIAGATGSYESMSHSQVLYAKSTWLYTCENSKERRLQLEQYYKFILPDRTPLRSLYLKIYCEHIKSNKPIHEKLKMSLRLLIGQAPQYLTISHLLSSVRNLLSSYGGRKNVCDYKTWWKRKLECEPDLVKLIAFPPFPNPHIRTNGFLIQRQDYIESAPLPINTKIDAFNLESGSNGITARVLKSGRRALIVDRHGTGYDVADWPKSRTFRSLEGANLLVEDNRTREYEGMSPQERITLAVAAWGLNNVSPPNDFPDMGF